METLVLKYQLKIEEVLLQIQSILYISIFSNSYQA